MSKIKVESCPVCHSSGFIDFIQCVDYYTSQERYSLQTCTCCGFVFTQSFPSEDEIGRYYEVNEYVSHTDSKKGIVNFLYHIARDFMLDKKVNLIRKLTGLAKGRLLDYGCGTAYFLNRISEKGWDVTGLEKSAQARQYAAEKFSKEILDPSCIREFEAGRFDVITLWHVLEHIENLNEMVDVFHKLLTPDGYLIVAVPNRKSFDAAFYKEYWAAYDVPRHLWHFESDAVVNLMNKHGFELKQKQSMPLDAFYISMLSEKYRNRSVSFLRGLVVGFRALIATMTDVDKSSSIIYVLKKAE